MLTPKQMQKRGWYDKNKEYARKYARDWYHTHKDEYREVFNERQKRRRYASGGKPMSENKDCTSYLGIHIAENIFPHVFENAMRMPNNNQHYDFICEDKLVDVKSATKTNRIRGASGTITSHWSFSVRKNKVADCFMCIAFDDRINLNIEHIWMIPGDIVNNNINFSISESNLQKWVQYEISVPYLE
jgi:hypothetical protein